MSHRSRYGSGTVQSGGIESARRILNSAEFARVPLGFHDDPYSLGGHEPIKMREICIKLIVPMAVVVCSCYRCSLPTSIIMLLLLLPYYLYVVTQQGRRSWSASADQTRTRRTVVMITIITALLCLGITSYRTYWSPITCYSVDNTPGAPLMQDEFSLTNNNIFAPLPTYSVHTSLNNPSTLAKLEGGDGLGHVRTRGWDWSRTLYFTDSDGKIGAILQHDPSKFFGYAMQIQMCGQTQDTYQITRKASINILNAFAHPLRVGTVHKNNIPIGSASYPLKIFPPLIVWKESAEEEELGRISWEWTYTLWRYRWTLSTADPDQLPPVALAFLQVFAMELMAQSNSGSKGSSRR